MDHLLRVPLAAGERNEVYLDRIFMPFERLRHRDSPYGGIGIGLAICRKVAEIHGGTIVARIMPGKRSTFTVILPSKQIREQTYPYQNTQAFRVINFFNGDLCYSASRNGIRRMGNPRPVLPGIIK